MMKKNLTRLSVILLGLIYLGLTGLLIGLVDINSNYKENKDIISNLEGEAILLHDRVLDSVVRLKNYEFMEYKVNAFSKRYPQYAKILDSVYQKSHQYGFKPNLVLSIIKVESYYNPTAVSYRGAYGLMQVNLSVWEKELGIDRDRIFDIDYNINLGLKILKHYYEEANGNLKRALHLYNNGYKYNNTAYALKVNSTFQSLAPDPELNSTLSGYGR